VYRRERVGRTSMMVEAVSEDLVAVVKVWRRMRRRSGHAAWT
jgi:hypothetical protein